MIITQRLELIPATLELCDAETAGSEALSQLLRARVSSSWPPSVFERDDVKRLRQMLEADPVEESWTLHYILLHARAKDEGRELVGIAGYAGPPTETGIVEIGYAITTEHQRQGYATEAVNALVSRAFADPSVNTIRANTYPTLEPSIKVLEKTKFVRIGSESKSGVVSYERRRESSDRMNPCGGYGSPGSRA
jgi:RimJ/RimL family protein N-acetyltransferase